MSGGRLKKRGLANKVQTGLSDRRLNFASPGARMALRSGVCPKILENFRYEVLSLSFFHGYILLKASTTSSNPSLVAPVTSSCANKVVASRNKRKA